jgi:hypothetical protein
VYLLAIRTDVQLPPAAKYVVLGVVTACVALSAGAYLFLRTTVTNDAVRRALAAQISSSLGQPVAIGRIGLSVLPRLAITLSDVEIGERPPVRVKSLKVATDLAALLQRRIEHATLRLDGAEVPLPLPRFVFRSSPAAAPSSSPIELTSIDEVVLEDVVVQSGGRTLRADVDVVPRDHGLVIRRISVAAEDTTLVASGELTDLGGPVGTLALSAGALNIDRFFAFVSDFSRDILPVATQSPDSGPMPSAMNLTINVDAERATIGRMTIGHMKGQVVARDARLALSPVTFELFNGRYDGSLVVGLDTAMPTYRWKATLSDVDVAQAAAFAGRPDVVSGRLNGRID